MCGREEIPLPRPRDRDDKRRELIRPSRPFLVSPQMRLGRVLDAYLPRPAHYPPLPILGVGF